MQQKEREVFDSFSKTVICTSLTSLTNKVNLMCYVFFYIF